MPISVSDATHEWEAPLDPHEHKPYTFKFIKELAATGEKIASTTWTLSSDAIAAGVEISDDSFDDDTASVWLNVNAANREDVTFKSPGAIYTIKVHMEDTSSRVARYERTIKFTVTQL